MSTSVVIPDSRLSRAAESVLVTTSPAPLVEHGRRTYLFGAAILDRQGRRYDAEALHVASLLHDLGLTEYAEDGVTPFEQRGAQLAAEAVLEQEGRPELASLVHDAIALHLELTSLEEPRPEVAGVAIGATADVLGLGLDQLDPTWVAQTLERHPRDGLGDLLTEALRHQVELKPQSRLARHIDKFRFVDPIGR